MNTTQSLIFACCAMMFLVLIVSLRLMYLRFTEPMQKRIHPQKLANSKLIAEQLTLSTTTADNYRNLFELPVLFYLLCALAIAMQVESVFLSIAAWVFVGLRYIHSAIHCTYNTVMHRFSAFVLGMLVLLSMWIAFIAQQL
jgi:hypothetical protein